MVRPVGNGDHGQDSDLQFATGRILLSVVARRSGRALDGGHPAIDLGENFVIDGDDEIQGLAAEDGAVASPPAEALRRSARDCLTNPQLNLSPASMAFIAAVSFRRRAVP